MHTSQTITDTGPGLAGSNAGGEAVLNPSWEKLGCRGEELGDLVRVSRPHVDTQSASNGVIGSRRDSPGSSRKGARWVRCTRNIGSAEEFAGVFGAIARPGTGCCVGCLGGAVAPSGRRDVQVRSAPVSERTAAHITEG